MREGGALVGRLRIRAPAGLRFDAEAATARRLSTVDIRTGALPPAAILCIRSLDDPLPGTLRVDDAFGAPPTAWTAALASSIDGLARAAAHPADGPVPASAGAVVFRDRVELLACVAEDWATADGRARWWWRSLVGSGLRVVEDAWLREPQLVPAVMDRLDRRGRLSDALAGFSGSDARRVAVAVLEAVGATDATVAVGAIESGEPATTAPSSPSTRPAAARLPISRPSLAGLAPAAMTLTIVALAAHRRPDVVRSGALVDLVRAMKTAPPPRPQAARLPASPPVTDSGPVSPSGSRPVRQPVARPDRGRAGGVPRDRRHTPASAVADGRPKGDRHVGETGVRPPQTTPSAPQAPAWVEDPGTRPDTERAWGPEAVRTGLGGLFYLLPLAIQLDLYADFTRPAWRPLALDPWDFVTLMGRELGAADRPGSEDDPAWSLLADLAGRHPATSADARWRPGRDWRIDRAWLTTMPPARAWTWSRHGGRLRVEHPDGFAILDVRVGAATDRGVRARLHREIPSLADVPPLNFADTTSRRGRSARAAWVAETAAYVRPRLRNALGLADPDGLASLVFDHDARVFVDAEAVTVELSLETHPIEIRIAGLDRDQGWIPAARRRLAFRFI